MRELSRVFGNDLSMINYFHIEHHALKEVLEHAASVLRRLALPERRQARR